MHEIYDSELWTDHYLGGEGCKDERNGHNNRPSHSRQPEPKPVRNNSCQKACKISHRRSDRAHKSNRRRARFGKDGQVMVLEDTKDVFGGGKDERVDEEGAQDD